MAAAEHNITIEQGTVFVLEGTLYTDDPPVTPFDFTGYTMRGQVRRRYGGDLLAEFECTFPTPTAGTWKARIGAIASAATPTTLRNGAHTTLWVYDLELVPPSGEDDAERFMYGTVTVTPEATTDA